MQNPVLEKIKTSIRDGGWWQSSIADAAEDFLATVDQEDVVNVAVMGDYDLDNVRTIARHIDTLRNYLDDKLYYRIIVGDRSGVEQVVAKICERNEIPYLVIKMNEANDANERKAVSKELDEALLNRCVALMTITRGSDKSLEKVFNRARSSGRAVSKRITGVAK